MKLHYIGIIAGAALISAPSFANIASSGYVDEQVNAVKTTVNSKLNGTFTEKNLAMTTDDSGAVVVTTVKTGMIESANVTNDKLAGGIGIDKLQLPTKCTNGKTCILIYDGTSGTYTWEEIGRATTGDTAPAGGISGSGSNN